MCLGSICLTTHVPFGLVAFNPTSLPAASSATTLHPFPTQAPEISIGKGRPVLTSTRTDSKAEVATVMEKDS